MWPIKVCKMKLDISIEPLSSYFNLILYSLMSQKVLTVSMKQTRATIVAHVTFCDLTIHELPQTDRRISLWGCFPAYPHGSAVTAQTQVHRNTSVQKHLSTGTSIRVRTRHKTRPVSSAYTYIRTDYTMRQLHLQQHYSQRPTFKNVLM